MSTNIKEAIDSFLLSCKVEGKSYGTIECYSDKLKGFLWYATNYNWPDDITAITTNHLKEFLAYLRETPHRFNSTCPRAMKPINGTTIQKYYRALSALFNWSVNEGILETNSLVKIKVPRAEKKVVKSLSNTEVNQLISSFRDTFDGIRNKAIILVLVDCGLRLGELLSIKMMDINMEQQQMKVDGKTGGEGKNRVILTRFDIGIVLPIHRERGGSNELEKPRLNRDGLPYIREWGGAQGQVKRST